MARHSNSTPDGSDEGAAPLWREEWQGDDGEIQTGGLPDEFDPHDFDEVLTHLGYAPGEVRMELVASTRWQQRSKVSNATEDEPAVYEVVWLNAYRYRATKNALITNLPALYAETRAKRPGRKTTPPPTGEATVVVCWADIQTGKVDELGGLEELLGRLNDKRANLDAYLREEPFDRIVVCDVGDILEGFENTKQQRTTNCLSLMDQVEVASVEFWKTIALCEEFAPVDVLSIPSNHCQWRRGKELLGRPTDDWGLHINKMLEHRNEEAGLDLTFHRPDDWSEHLTLDVRGTVLGLAHGHQAANPDKVREWWSKLNHGGVLDCDVLLTGHFHYFSMRPSGRNHRTGRARWHIQAPTLDNGSAWVRNKMGEDGDPGLCVFKINDEGLDLNAFRIL